MDEQTQQSTPADDPGAALLNVKRLPSGLAKVRDLSREARAYQAMNAYPIYHFKDWMTENRGPLPRCLPLAKSIVGRGAKWLFGKPLQLTVPGNTTLETRLRDAWKANLMDARVVAMAKDAAVDGGIVLKFSYDEAQKACPLKFQSLSLVDEARLFYDPHDCTRLLMARVQYCYYDAALGKSLWYREEWTETLEVHYAPVSVEQITTAKTDPDTYEGWVESSRTPNSFGVIPLIQIKNLETDDLYGAADLWDAAEGNGLFRILDRLHLTFHLMDRSNQFDSEINPIFIDLEVDDQDVDKPLQPGQPMDMQSKGDTHQGKVEFPRGANGLRPAMMEYAKEMKKFVLEACSSVQVDQGEFTNKGNLTSAVLEQLYLPQIELTEEKRKSWGGGLCAFFALVAQGLEAAGVTLGITDQAESYAVTLAWPAYFPKSEDEKTAAMGRIQEEEIAGYVTHDRAIEEVAHLENRADVAALKQELANEPRPTPTEADPSLQNMETEVKGLNRLGGDSSK